MKYKAFGAVKVFHRPLLKTAENHFTVFYKKPRNAEFQALLGLVDNCSQKKNKGKNGIHNLCPKKIIFASKKRHFIDGILTKWYIKTAIHL